MTNPRWRKLINAFSALADMANAAGIGSHIIISLVPIGKALFESVFSVLTFYADPLIYCFRAAIRVIRLIGRKFYPDETDFEEEQYGLHPQQNKVDVIATSIFLVAIGLFFIPSSLLGLQAALAWFLGLTGTVITIYFDHYWPSKKAREKLENLEKESEEYKNTETYANQKYYSARLYATLICGMLMLLVIGSITTAGFPLSVTTLFVLNGIAKMGSMLLVAVNIARPINWAFPNAFNKAFCWVKEKIHYCFGKEQPEADNRPAEKRLPSTRSSSTASILAEAPPANKLTPAKPTLSADKLPPGEPLPVVEVTAQDDPKPIHRTRRTPLSCSIL
jgi:hypothetical protein